MQNIIEFPLELSKIKILQNLENYDFLLLIIARKTQFPIHV